MAAMTDPGELFRFWMQVRYHEQGFSVPKLAFVLRVKPVTVGHWLRNRGTIRTAYWPEIATFFHKDQPEHMLEEARELWAVADNRRYYTLHAAERALRRRVTGTATNRTRSAGARSAPASGAGPVHPETPVAAAAIADSIDAATKPNRSRPPARRARARKTHGRRAGA